mmetsp:Transcript_20551/g.52048  ORF Transcript_20551/g.52048 Transcript_20551/m.52048 type:complete len:173 (-) Transcript_20551:64-582(-)
MTDRSEQEACTSHPASTQTWHALDRLFEPLLSVRRLPTDVPPSASSPFSDPTSEQKTSLERSELVDDLLLALSATLGEEEVMRALQLVDLQRVTSIQASPSGRICFRVGDRTGKEFIACLRDYCPCQEFQSQVLSNRRAMCIHQLAARLALALGTCTQRFISDLEFPSWLAP